MLKGLGFPKSCSAIKINQDLMTNIPLNWDHTCNHEYMDSPKLVKIAQQSNNVLAVNNEHFYLSSYYIYTVYEVIITLSTPVVRLWSVKKRSFKRRYYVHWENIA